MDVLAFNAAAMSNLIVGSRRPKWLAFGCSARLPVRSMQRDSRTRIFGEMIGDARREVSIADRSHQIIQKHGVSIGEY